MGLFAYRRRFRYYSEQEANVAIKDTLASVIVSRALIGSYEIFVSITS